MRRVLLAMLIVFSTVVLFSLTFTTKAHAESMSGGSAWWQGQGTYNNGNPPFQMLLKISVQGGSLSGTLEEQTYNDTIVAVSGTASTNTDGSVAISFTTNAYIQGNSVCLNCIYNATYDSTTLYGTWMYPGNSSPDGNFELTNATKAANAIAWAESPQANDPKYNGLCEVFVENAYGTQYRFASAQKAFDGLPHSTDWSPDIGALVFFQYFNPTDQQWDGHVGIYLGGGQFISALQSSPVVQIKSLQAWSASYPYEGWANVPSDWPGR